MQDDPRLAEAQAMPIEEIANRLGLTAGLRRMSGELVGPCPKCGGHDRFGINLRKGKFLCRRCDIKGDGISLVEAVLGLDFQKALAWLVGERNDVVDPAELARRRQRAEDTRRQREAEEARRRQAAIERARRIWNTGIAIAGSPVEGYLARRGLAAYTPEFDVIRYVPDLPYMLEVGGGLVKHLHSGPAMVAAIVNAAGVVAAVHQTWIDLSQPKGKLKIAHDGAPLPAKKVVGSKKGGAIRLRRSQGDRTIVMGEGIETTATALVSGAYPQAAFWAGVDLGNMGGQRKLGPGLKFAGIPDLDDAEAFVPPDRCERLVFIQDGDSEPKLTRAKLLAGLRRAKAKARLAGRDLTCVLVHAGEGRDLNDIVAEVTE
jgi:hypothetical protein